MPATPKAICATTAKTLKTGEHRIQRHASAQRRDVRPGTQERGQEYARRRRRVPSALRRSRLKPCRSGFNPPMTPISRTSARPLSHFTTISDPRVARASTAFDGTLAPPRSNPSRWRRMCRPSTSGLARRSTASNPASDALVTRVRHSEDSIHQTAKSTTDLQAEVDKLRAALTAVHAGVEATRGMLEAVGELDARIRADRDTEQAAAAVRQIGETLETMSAQAATATEQTVKSAELFRRSRTQCTDDRGRDPAHDGRPPASSPARPNRGPKPFADTTIQAGISGTETDERLPARCGSRTHRRRNVHSPYVPPARRVAGPYPSGRAVTRARYSTPTGGMGTSPKRLRRW